jgi:hypothetical protein
MSVIATTKNLLALLALLTLLATPAFAQDAGTAEQGNGRGGTEVVPAYTPSNAPASQGLLTYQPLVNIPGVSNNQLNFNTYINQLYFLSISIAALLAVIKIILGGVQWMLSDIVTQKSDAKKEIWGALLGLLLIISAVLILGTINPQLTTLNVLSRADPLRLDGAAPAYNPRIQEIVVGALAGNEITPTSTPTGGNNAPAVPTAVAGNTVLEAIARDIGPGFTTTFTVIVPVEPSEVSRVRASAEIRCRNDGGQLGDIRVREGSGESQYYFCAKRS